MLLVCDAFGKPDPGQCCSRRNWNYRAEGLRSWLWFAGATSPWAGENVGAVLLPLKLYLPLILAFQFPHTAQTPPLHPLPLPSLCFPYKDWPSHFLSFSVGRGRLVCEHGQVRGIAAEFFLFIDEQSQESYAKSWWMHATLSSGESPITSLAAFFINPTAPFNLIFDQMILLYRFGL